MADDFEMEETIDALDRAVISSRQFVRDARNGLRYPPQLSRKVAEASEEFSSYLTEIWMRIQHFDSPAGFANNDSRGIPDDLNDILVKAIEWSTNDAIGFSIAAGDDH